MDFRKGIETLYTSKGEKIELKKSKLFGWGIVYPWRNEEGSWDWFNFLTGGKWAKIIILVVIILIILGCFFEYLAILKLANECLKQNPITKGVF